MKIHLFHLNMFLSFLLVFNVLFFVHFFSYIVYSISFPTSSTLPPNSPFIVFSYFYSQPLLHFLQCLTSILLYQSFKALEKVNGQDNGWSFHFFADIVTYRHVDRQQHEISSYKTALLSNDPVNNGRCQVITSQLHARTERLLREVFYAVHSEILKARKVSGQSQ